MGCLESDDQSRKIGCVPHTEYGARSHAYLVPVVLIIATWMKEATVRRDGWRP